MWCLPIIAALFLFANAAKEEATLHVAVVDEEHSHLYSKGGLYLTKDMPAVAVRCTDPDKMNHQIQWFKDDKEMGEMQIKDDEQRTIKDVGKYQCKGKSGISAEFEVFKADPKITTTPERVVNSDFKGVPKKDRSQLLACALEGQSDAKYEWFKNGKPVKDRKSKSRYQVQSNQTLLLTRMDASSSGVYMCVFEGGQRNWINVFWRPIPNDETQTRGKNAMEGDHVTLRCSFVAFPKPSTVIWSKDGRVFNDSDKHVKFSTEHGIPKSKLRIDEVEDKDAGEYSCYVENGFGNATITRTVRVKDRLAALWPFLGIVAEVAILVAVILLYERHQKRKQAAEESAGTEEQKLPLAENGAEKDGDMRQRKV